MSAGHKNIIIIGASFSGHTLANQLASSLPKDYRVLLVERNQFAVYAPAMVRALVVPGWEKNVMVPVTQEAIFPQGSRHRVIVPNNVVSLKEKSIILEKPFEGSTEVFFEHCVIATGATQPSPVIPKAFASISDAEADIKRVQSEIAKAQKIVVIGGGMVGIEIAGEINSRYPDKSLAIVHSGKELLNGNSDINDSAFYSRPSVDRKVGDSLQAQLRERGVKVLTGERVVIPKTPEEALETEWNGEQGYLATTKTVKLSSGESLEADYILVATGNTPNSGLVQAADPGAVSINKYITVNDHFRVQASGATSPLSGAYYALGDVAAIGGPKTAVASGDQAPALSAIINAHIRGKAGKAYQPSSMISAAVVSLGTSGGAGVLPMPLFGLVSAPGFILSAKRKDFFAQRSFYPRFKGSQKVVAVKV